MKKHRQKIAIGFAVTTVRTYFQKNLQELGYNAVDFIEQQSGVDLILLDWNMAGRIGKQALKQKEKMPGFLPLLIAIKEGEDPSPWLEAGFDDVLRLPCSNRELKARIALMLRLRRQTLETNRLENERIESEANLQSLINARDESIWSVDTDFRYVFFTERFAAGYKAVYGVTLEKGMNALDILSPELQKFWEPKYTKALGGKSMSFEFSETLPDGPHVFEVILNPIRSGKKIIGVSSISIDITERRKIEDALRYRERLLNEAQRIAHIGSWELDLVNNKLFWSDEIYRIFDLEPQEFSATYEAFLSYVHPEDRDLVNEAYTSSVANKTPYDIVHRLRLKDGRIKYVNERCETEYDESGKALRSIGTVHDITDRKQAEEALRESEERFRLAFHTSPDSISISRLEDGVYIDVNQGFSDITGYTREEVIGKSALEINIWADPADRQKLVQGIKEKGQITNLETRFKMKDGSTITGLLSAKIINIHGKTSIMSIARNIDEIKKAQNALKKSEENYRMLMEFASDAFFQEDKGGNFIEANNRACELTGYSKKEILSLKMQDLFPEAILNQKPLRYDRLKKGQVVKTERMLKRKDGRLVAVEIQSKMMPDGTYQSFFRDITERKKAESALQKSEERYRYLFENSPVALWEEDLTDMIEYLQKILERRVKKQQLKSYLDRHPNDVQALLSRIRILNVNRAAVRLHHARNKQELMTKLESLFTEDSFALFKDEICAIARGESNYTNEERVKTLDGKIKHIYLHFSLKRPQPGTENKYIGLIATTDITDLKRAEEEIRRSRARLEVLHQLDGAILQARSVEDISQAALHHLQQLISARRVSIAVFNEAQDQAKLYSRGLLESEFGQAYTIPITGIFNDLAGLREGKVSRLSHFEKIPDLHRIIKRMKDAGVRSALNIPVISQGKLLGSLNLAFTQPESFSKWDIEVGKEVADSVAIALYQASLHEELEIHAEELEQSLHELRQIHELSQQMSGDKNKQQVAEETIQILRSALKPDVLLFYLRNRGKLELLSHHSNTTKFIVSEAAHHSVGECLCGLTAQSAQPVFSKHIQEDVRCTLNECKNAGIVSFAGFPLLAGEKVIGVIGLGSLEERDFPLQRPFLETLANEAAVGLQNALLLEELRHHEAELEQRVAERTVELERANKELESFSYSVSHDLRAPLRAIDGFSRILAEDYIAQLDDEACRLIKIVRDNTQRMGQLIDDLLNFSRISRHSIKPAAIDMANLADSIYQELTDAAQRKKIRFRIQNGLPPAVADASLMRQVFVNLLSNALKFSSGRKTPRIEIGFTIENDRAVYYIKDNGVGFNMHYADKLFQIFQRLHTSEEFPGTGIGLSIVQRIIAGHGGDVWADSIEGKGATFYFTLPLKSVNQ